MTRESASSCLIHFINTMSRMPRIASIRIVACLLTVAGSLGISQQQQNPLASFLQQLIVSQDGMRPIRHGSTEAKICFCSSTVELIFFLNMGFDKSCTRSTRTAKEKQSPSKSMK